MNERGIPDQKTIFPKAPAPKEITGTEPMHTFELKLPRTVMSRRRFLQLLLGTGALVGAALKLGMWRNNPPPESSQPESSQPEVTEIVDETILTAFEQWSANPANIADHAQAQGFPEKTRQYLTASAVTMITTEIVQGETKYFLGSASIVEHKDEIYIATAQHVIKDSLLNNNGSAYVGIPGLEPFEFNPHDAYSFTEIQPELFKSEKADFVVFLKVPKQVLEKMQTPEMQNSLKPLQLFALLGTGADVSDLSKQSVSLFRFQASKFASTALTPTHTTFYPELRQSVSYARQDNADPPVVCGGTSGSPILVVENGSPTGYMAGVVQERVGDEDAEDPLGVFGENCTPELTFTAWGAATQGGQLRKTHLR